MLKRLSVFIGAIAIVAGLTSATAWAAPTRINSCQTISSQGSYVLTRSLNATALVGDYLYITADFVTINLNGFIIAGPGFLGGVPSGHGIATDLGVSNTTVRNGTVIGFNYGVFLSSGGSRVEGMRVVDSAFGGISVAHGAYVANNIVTGSQSNSLPGISFTQGSTVINNVSRGNTAMGIDGNCPSTVVGNTATDNGGSNLILTPAPDPCTDEHNTAP